MLSCATADHKHVLGMLSGQGTAEDELCYYSIIAVSEVAHVPSAAQHRSRPAVYAEPFEHRTELEVATAAASAR